MVIWLFGLVVLSVTDAVGQNVGPFYRTTVANIPNGFPNLSSLIRTQLRPPRDFWRVMFVERGSRTLGITNQPRVKWINLFQFSLE